MNKTIIILLFSPLIIATTVHAEHKLFITDVLAAKQFEVEANFSYAHSSADTTTKYPHWDPTNGVRTNDVDIPGSQTHNTFSSIYSFGVGLSHGLQLNAAIPFKFMDKTKQQDLEMERNGYVNETNQDGVGDIAVGVKYSLYESKSFPLIVVTGLDVKFYTAESKKAGSGTNDIAPFIAVSTSVYPALRPYASYRAIFRDHGAEDSHIFSAGIEYEANKSFTLRPELISIFRTDSDWARPYNTYFLGLASYVKIFSNLYLIPHFNTGVSTSTSLKNDYMHFSTLRFIDTGLGLYYLFN